MIFWTAINGPKLSWLWRRHSTLPKAQDRPSENPETCQRRRAAKKTCKHLEPGETVSAIDRENGLELWLDSQLAGCGGEGSVGREVGTLAGSCIQQEISVYLIAAFTFRK